MMENHQGMEMNTISSPRGGGSPSTHRWNPTKEQINILENMYQQGVRTPSAEQIQDITTKLKVYGHIEGKNVFYWFQNHKARQRQKEKQDHRMSESFSRLFQHSSPLFPPPPCPNVVCSPYYLGPGPVGFYPQCPPKLYLPPIGKKRSHTMPSEHYIGNPNFWDHGDQSAAAARKLGSDYHHRCMALMRSPSTQETLELFPMHPTGILQEKSTLNESPENSNVPTTTTTPSSSSDTTMCLNEQEAAAAVADQRFFDFFTGNIGAPFDQSR